MRHKDREWFEVFYQDRFFRIEGEVLHDSISDSYIASIELISDDCKDGLELFNRSYKDLQYSIKAIKSNYKVTIQKTIQEIAMKMPKKSKSKMRSNATKASKSKKHCQDCYLISEW